LDLTSAMLVITLVALTISGPTVASEIPQIVTDVQVAQQQTPANQPAQPPEPVDRDQAKQPPDQKAEAKEPPTPERTGIRALFHNLVEDYQKLPSKQNLYLAGIGGGLAAVAHPADANLNARLRGSYGTANTVFGPGKYLGDTPEQVALSLGAYAYGRLFQQPKVSHLGMDLLQAQILTESLVEPLKFATRRQRPDQSNHQSFPSGHAAITFAGATVLERHLGWRNSLLAYGVASYVAASRLHDNRHYLSDVVFGAAVGSIAGRTVVHHASDYWALTPVNVPGGVAILVSRVGDR
jgi:PAP2 superfamily